MTKHRTERDSLGAKDVPAHAYFGVHTMRAVENFRITGTQIATNPELIVALAAVKQASAMANRDLGLLSAAKAAAIVRACEEIRSGELHAQFVVDVIQGGAGTSTNMNANEVIANRALEYLGREPGDYAFLHPIDDVNLSQSTNDVYPSAARLALYLASGRLGETLARLRAALDERATAFASTLKVGRTQLQDAVPMTLGQEFGAYAVMVGEDEERLAEARQLLTEINLGGTAIGTGLNASPEYRALAIGHLASITAVPVVACANTIEATQDVGVFVQLSGVLKRIAVKLSKVCNDLRLLSSGPRAGLAEISLPAVQAGSSIMPGKTNPVIPEVVNQIAFEVIGNDVTVSLAAEAGQLQLNAFQPIIVHSLTKDLAHLRAGCDALAERCVAGITPNTARLKELVERSIGTVCALTPHIGYETAATVAREALRSGRPVRELLLDRRLLDPEEIDFLLEPARLAGIQLEP
jgi:aspartate ammonia-lyase